MTPQRAFWITIIGATLISFSGVWVKWAQVAPGVSAFYRVLFGGFFLLLAAGWRREIGGRGFTFNWRWPLCSLLYALDLYLYHLAILIIGPGLGTILPNFQVFILATAGILFFAEPFRWLLLPALPMALGGLYLIVGLNAGPTPIDQGVGLAAGFGAAVFYGVFLLLLRQIQAGEKSVSVFRVLMLVSFGAALLLGVEIWLQGGSFRIPDVKSVLALIGLGFFSQGLGWVLITNALPRLAPSVAGLLLLLQPTLAFVWDVLIFRRPTTGLNWLGVALALLGIYLGMGGQRSRPSADLQAPPLAGTSR
jgi:drug/metabolite transporter (DMT)-like permease